MQGYVVKSLATSGNTGSWQKQLIFSFGGIYKDEANVA